MNRTTSLGISVERNRTGSGAVRGGPRGPGGAGGTGPEPRDVRPVGRPVVRDSPGDRPVLGPGPRRSVLAGWCGRTEHAPVADDVDAAPVAGAAPYGRDQLVQDRQVGQI